MADAKGKQCDFCGAFLDAKDGGTWSLNLVYDRIPARFEGQKSAPDICAECVAKALDAIASHVRIVPKEESEEIAAIIIASHRR